MITAHTQPKVTDVLREIGSNVGGVLRQYKWAALSTLVLGLAVHWRRSRAARQVGF
jgi:hypothetical protein